MKVLITGATKGIGYFLALCYKKKGYDVIGVGRSKDGLENLKNEGITPVLLDISDEENAKALFKMHPDVDILINNAGFGDVGFFSETDLEKDIKMIKTNVLALHILTKLYFKEMVKNNKGHILNVASVAGFMPGPLMATYYSTKAYVLRLSISLMEEANKLKSRVKISVLCPGPVNTDFNDTAGVKFKLKGKSPEYVAKYTVSKMEKNKKIIVPGIDIKMARFLLKLIPERAAAKIAYKMQRKKTHS